jgi:beta-1,4-mannooligosaccharide/beta-1,4-mannosyl-N-acetylglucosamine phosphorylase
MRYQEPRCVSRCEHNPLLTPRDIPYPCDRVYNPAACKVNGEYVLILRIQDSARGSQCLGLARSDDGVRFRVEPEPLLTPAPDEHGKINDPRITYIDGWHYLTYCSDPSAPDLREDGIFLCIARSRDLRKWERIYRSEPDNRNAVIFPEKINGLYARLDRPFRRGYKTEHGYDIWVSYSPDMEFWGRHRLVLSHRDVAWGHHKIGPGAPPIRTKKGWLTLFHGAEIASPADGWAPWARGGVTKVYRTGVMLLDLENPSKVVGRLEDPLMEITAPYEQEPSYRPNVIFATGAILEPDGEVKIYYGASDTSICLARARVDDLMALCVGDV